MEGPSLEELAWQKLYKTITTTWCPKCAAKRGELCIGEKSHATFNLHSARLNQ